MVQEVQQQGNWYQTPNEIQGIGDIRRRVREHTQVTPSFSYSCSVYGNVTITFLAYETVEKEGSVSSITASYGNTVFNLFNNGLQIPLAGAYMVELSAKGGVSAAPLTHYIRLGSDNLIQITTNSSSRATTTATLNLGKGNFLKYYGKVVNGTGGTGNANGEINLTLRKI